MITIDISKEINRVSQHNKRAEAVGAPATLTIEQWLKIIEKYKGHCAYCKKVPFDTLEHYIPLSAQGGTTAENCYPVCQTCNLQKAGFNINSVQDRRQATVYLPTPLHKWLKAQSAEEEREMSEIVTEALAMYREMRENTRTRE